jgi:hypothetical protein
MSAKKKCKKCPGLKTIKEIMDAVPGYCGYCDFNDDCPNRLSNLKVIAVDLSGWEIDDEEYDYEQPYVDFVCTKADIRNFAKKWPHKNKKKVKHEKE